jgi:hypothetical protein
MPCAHVTPAKGHAKEIKCKNPESKGGFCDQHQPKPVIVAVTLVTLTWFPKPEAGTAVNATFQAACDGMADHIENTCQTGIQSGGMPFKGKGTKGPHSLLHNTKPRANDAVFYKWTGSSMEVFGVGSHGVTNTDYVLTWYDGSRATVDLKAKTIV